MRIIYIQPRGFTYILIF